MTPSGTRTGLRSDVRAMRAALKKRAAESSSTRTFADPRFPEQAAAFLADPARLIVVLCTRRAGKSWGIGLRLFRDALDNPGVSCLYIALTRESAKRIMVKDVLLPLNRLLGIGAHYNITDQTFTLPNGSVIYLLGLDSDEKQKEKVLGQKFKTIVIDESASFSIDLVSLIYSKLKPATADMKGTIFLVGTPGNIKRGLYFELTKAQDPCTPGTWNASATLDVNGKSVTYGGWSGHRWSAFQNPYMDWAGEIEEAKAQAPGIEETPAFQQDYYGRWVIDDSKLVYRFLEGRNTYTKLPEYQGGRWHHVVAIDLGYEDATAITSMQYHDFDPCLYVGRNTERTKMDVTAVAEAVKATPEHVDADCTVIDGANKQVVQELRSRHSLELVAADKTGKMDFIQVLNSEMLRGKVKIHPSCTALVKELQELILNPKSAVPEEHPACNNHSCFPAGTLVEMEDGRKAIEQLRPGDMVLTRAGFRAVLAVAKTGRKPTARLVLDNGAELVGTEDHRIWTVDSGWVRLSGLTPSDTVLYCATCEHARFQGVERCCCAKSSVAATTDSYPKASNCGCSSQENTGAPQRKSYGEGVCGEGGLALLTPAGEGTSRAMRSICTEPSGNISTVQSQRDGTCITATETQVTTHQRTCAWFLRLITRLFTGPRNEPKHPEKCFLPSNTLPPHGTPRTQVGNGTPTTESKHGLGAHRINTRAAYAGGCSVLELVPLTCAATIASPSGEETADLMMSIPPARDAEEPSGETSTPNRCIAPVHVRGVASTGYEETVYALSVDGEHEYFANGVLVKNCDTLLYGWRKCYQYLSAKEEKKPRAGTPEASRLEQLAMDEEADDAAKLQREGGDEERRTFAEIPDDVFVQEW